ncbi:peptidase M48, partial [Streptomyces albidoflavus]
ASGYAEEVRTSKDPLMKLVTDLADGAGDLGGRLRDRFTGGTRPNGNPGAGAEDPSDGGGSS